MTTRLDQNDAFHDDAYYDEREEARTEAARAYPEPRPGSRQDAIDRGYNPADWED